MAIGHMNRVIHHLRKLALASDGATMTDGQLLECFISRRAEAALEALVVRHGPMVWGVCRRLLNHHDAEDAFQATFLVLVRKAGSIVPREMVGNWLYGVAHQAALNARTRIARQRTREVQVTEMPEPAAMNSNAWPDLQPLLDQELSRLPDKYRAVILLCDLEGKTRKEAARQLDCAEGTVAGRLARARTMLAKRLARHGLAISGGALAGALSQKAASAAAPPTVMASTIKAATLVAAGQAAAGVISARAVALMQGVVNAMFISKLKTVMSVVLSLGLIVVGGGLLTQHPAVGQPGELGKPAVTEKVRLAEGKKDVKPAEPPKTDKEKLQGRWKVESLQFAGKEPQGDDAKKAMKQPYEFKEDKLIAKGKYKYTIDSKKKPKEIDWEVEEGSETERGTWKGIYDLRGDELTLCLALPNQDRPTEFTSKEGELTLLLKLKRVNSPKDKKAAQPTPKAERAGNDEPRMLKLTEAVRSMRWSPDGKTMAGLSDGDQWLDPNTPAVYTLRIWDGQTGKLKKSLKLPEARMQMFDFSPDSKTIAIGSRRGSTDFLELRDVETGELRRTIEMEYRRAGLWFAFSPDSRTIAVCGAFNMNNSFESLLRLYDAKTGKLTQQRTWKGGLIMAIAFAADGKWLATADHKGAVTIWDLKNAKIHTTLTAAPARQLQFSPDGTHLLRWGQLSDVTVVDWATGKTRSLKDSAAGQGTQQLVYSPNGLFIAGQSWVFKDAEQKKCIRVWDAATGDLLHKQLVADTAVGLAFTPDSKRLVFLKDDKTVTSWDIGPPRANKNPRGDGAPRIDADDIAWGKPANGLEAGIGFPLGEAHTCRVGGSMRFYVYLRNVSDKPISFSYIETLYDEFVPTVEDGAGRKLRLVPGPANLGQASFVSRSISPGEIIRLAPCSFLVREPGLKGETVAPTLLATPGKYQVYHSGFPIRRKGDDSDKYTGPTGRVEFEIKPALGADQGKEPGKAKESRTDQENLQGTWVTVSQEFAGKAVTKEDLRPQWWHFEDDKVTIYGIDLRVSKPEKVEYSFSLATDKNPRTFSLSNGNRLEGPRTKAPDDVSGIYKFDGNSLVIAIGKRDLPTNFKTKDGDGVVVLVLKREGRAKEKK